MLTLAQCKLLRRGQILYHDKQRNADGSPVRWRVNGAVKTWKRDPNRIYVPLKHGLWSFSSIETKSDMAMLWLTEEEAKRKKPAICIL